MKLQQPLSQFRFLGGLIILLIGLAPAHAQSAGGDQKPDVKPATRAESEAGEVKALRSEIEQLRLLVEQQQRTLAEMQRRVDELGGARPAPRSRIARRRFTSGRTGI
ncbi:MAG TPA: hypothetical protein VKA60_04480 [Blastocatellia bacterium]|nr:hypothetical protein [Blastocatellia bacterium]